MTGSLTFSGPDWLPAAAIVFGVALLATVWSYRAGPPGRVRWLCAVLKALGIE